MLVFKNEKFACTTYCEKVAGSVSFPALSQGLASRAAVCKRQRTNFSSLKENSRDALIRKSWKYNHPLVFLSETDIYFPKDR